MNPQRTGRSRVLALSLPLLLVTGLAACGGDGPDGTDETDESDDAGDTGADEEAGTGDAAAGASDGTLTVYSGRGEDLVQPIIDLFEQESGIEVEVRYAGTAEMAAQLLEEGDGTPAQAFLAQDAGALGALSAEGLLGSLPDATLDLVPEAYRSGAGDWVGVTGRSRVLVYNEENVSDEELPASVFDLTGPDWTGRVGVAPTNASFQAFVTALRVQHGEDEAAAWLDDLAANDPEIYDGNGAILADVESGALDAGLINHYYLFGAAAEAGVAPEDLTATLHFFPDGDTGALVNISGAALIGEQPDGDAQAFIDFLLSDRGQEYFRDETHEYPMVDGIEPHEGLPPLEELQVPDVDLNDLADLETTVSLIAAAGLA